MNHLQREKEEAAILEREGWKMEFTPEDLERSNFLPPKRYYQRLRNAKDPSEERFTLVKFYFTHGFNKSLTAKAFGTTRNTVQKLVERYKREGRDGLRDKSRRPHSFPKRFDPKVEREIVDIFKKTNYGVRRIERILKSRGFNVSRGGIWKVLHRYDLYPPRKKVTIRKTGRRYYNPLDFAPFTFLQGDSKETIDGDTLPAEVYAHFLKLKEEGVPMIQFTLIDVRTRIRFLAYAQENSFANGWTFILLVVQWLRPFRVQISMQRLHEFRRVRKSRMPM